MDGQWLGNFTGTSAGIMMIDVDDYDDHIRGSAYAFDNNQGAPGIVTSFRTQDKNTVQKIYVALDYLFPHTLDLIPRHQWSQVFPNYQLAETATINLTVKHRSLQVAWHTPAGASGTAKLPRSKAGRPSEKKGDRSIRTWDKFKKFAIKLEPGRYIFRGQSRQDRLRTAFHRTKRKNLLQFIEEDIPALHRTLTARTRHLFNLADGAQNGAFWNLIQHHGYPAPLLDWTHSPFVAAFFAFRTNRQNAMDTKEKVRIIMFDRKQWVTDWQQLQRVHFTRPHFSILEALAIENERALPQQALSSITNVDDIESYIAERERDMSRSYIRVFDLPYTERDEVIKELRLMGITAGSMFPGFDGACEELRSRLFP